MDGNITVDFSGSLIDKAAVNHLKITVKKMQHYSAKRPFIQGNLTNVS
jgi:hypothetical protein